MFVRHKVRLPKIRQQKLVRKTSYGIKYVCKVFEANKGRHLP